MSNGLLLMYLILVNSVSFLMMGLDKLGARLQSSRIPEMYFLVASIVGGAVGILVGMLAFHHKTSKRSFQVKIAAASILFILTLVLLGLIG